MAVSIGDLTSKLISVQPKLCNHSERSPLYVLRLLLCLDLFQSVPVSRSLTPTNFPRVSTQISLILNSQSICLHVTCLFRRVYKIHNPSTKGFITQSLLTENNTRYLSCKVDTPLSCVYFFRHRI